MTTLKANLRWLKILPIFLRLKVDQSGKQQYHVSPLVHNGCPAVRTADFAWQFVHCSLLGALIPAEVVMTMCEVNIVFMENSGPLERSSWIMVRMNGRSLIVIDAG